MRLSGPHPEFGVVRHQSEDAPIALDVVGIEVHDLHVCADRLGPLLQGDVGVSLPLPEVLGLRIDAQSGIVVAERVRCALLREQDVALQAEGSQIPSVRRERVGGRRLRGLDPTDAQESRADSRIGLLEFLDSRRRLLRLEDLEGLGECNRRALLRVRFESGETGLSESVRFVEHPSFSRGCVGDRIDIVA